MNKVYKVCKQCQKKLEITCFHIKEHDLCQDCMDYGYFILTYKSKYDGSIRREKTTRKSSIHDFETASPGISVHEDYRQNITLHHVWELIAIEKIEERWAT